MSTPPPAREGASADAPGGAPGGTLDAAADAPPRPAPGAAAGGPQAIRPALLPAPATGAVVRTGPAAPGRAWVALAALAGVGALGAIALPAARIDWQPALAAREPWRALTAAFVHWSGLHLAANLAGAALVGALGRAAGLPAAAALAWLAAWPLTQLLLLVEPGLARFGGLSGVLHAGVAVAGLWLACRARGRPRGVGAGLLAGLALKVVLEDPLGAPLRAGGGWDIAIAPLAHATGAVAGLACAAAALWLCQRPPAPPQAQGPLR